MNKDLEWLRYYKEKLQESHQTFRPNGFDIIEKELKEGEKNKKALEIIKEHWEYNENGLEQIKPITKENADLLKEVLL